MKLFTFRSIIILLCLFLLCGCIPEDTIILSLPAYEKKVIYSEGSFQDYTDYAVYTYAGFDQSVLQNHRYLQPMTVNDLIALSAYLDNFEDWIRIYSERETPSQLAQNYHFDRSIADTDDYMFIRTKGTDLHPYTNYTVYFFDTGTGTLYYFHNNI